MFVVHPPNTTKVDILSPISQSSNSRQGHNPLNRVIKMRSHPSNNENNGGLTLKPHAPLIINLFKNLLRQGKLWPILHIS